MDNIVKGKIFLWQKKAWPATKEQAEKLSSILGIEVPINTLLVWVCAQTKGCNWNLKGYAEINTFPRNLPVFLLKDKKENDILELTIDDIPIQLHCKQLKQKSILFQDYLKCLTKKAKSVHFVLP